MSRSGGAGILAVCVLAVAWVLGSTALAILGFGIGLATLASRAWARFVSNGLTIERRPIEGPPVEGDALLLEAELAGRSWLASRVEWRERVERSASTPRWSRPTAGRASSFRACRAAATASARAGCSPPTRSG